MRLRWERGLRRLSRRDRRRRRSRLRRRDRQILVDEISPLRLAPRAWALRQTASAPSVLL